MGTEERLAKLERELADLRAGPKKHVRTRLLEITDENGNNRAVLRADEGGPTLELLDEKGNKRAVLRVDALGPVLYLLDEKCNRIWEATH
jgi:hypothetical protein